MNSNFDFLSQYWPELAQIGSAAESYLYSDQNACVYKIGLLSERIILKILGYENIAVPEDSRLSNLIKTLKYTDIIPNTVDDMLYSIRKARNSAVHESAATLEDAKVILRLGFNFASWFMEVYGDWQFKQPDFVMPEDISRNPDFKEMLLDQEEKIKELSKAIQEIKTSAENKTAEERQEKSKEVAAALDISEEEKLYLDKENIKLDITVEPVLNYVLYHNGLPIIQSVVIENKSDNDLEGISLVIKSTPQFIKPYTRTIEIIPKGKQLELRGFDISVDAEFLAQLTEKVPGSLELSFVKDDMVLCTESCNISVLAFDEWCGAVIHPELLTSFVTPNHPEVTKLISDASVFLKEWTGDSSLDAYQSQDPERIVKMAASAYAALQKANINYAVPPASFEKIGQRVRLVDAVIQQKMGTCLDLSLLYASCLEAMGLNPLLVLKPGHIFAGVWLDDLTFPEPVQDDPSLLAKRLASGINELIVVECTAFTGDKRISFEEAQKAAEADVNAANCIIDIKRSRNSNITPLPLRIHTDSGWKIEKPELSGASITAKPEEKIIRVIIDETAEGTVNSKKLQWERKLLDLGLRNTLINMRFTSKNLMPLFIHSIDEFEDALSSNKDLTLAPHPSEWHIPITSLGFDNMHDLGPYLNLIKSEFDNNRIRTSLADKAFEQGIKNLYRASKASIEENGANTLYLALGLLKWFETAKSKKPRYAPLILIPVDLIKKIRNQSFVIRLRDEDPQINITLLEKLKQDFSVIVNGLDPIPMDDAGLDTRKIFSIVRSAVMNQPGWDVLESAYLGIFSFSQFVMWNDIKNRSDDLAKNKVVKSLMDGKLSWEAQPMVMEGDIDENDVYVPVPVDASQLFAIKEAAEGKSFVLHGPPGTGKSQTITAMIANVLAQGKRVLFVAEKMAALEVVQTRLEKMGIGAFCLEVHSNKAKKKDVLEQLQRATHVSSTNSEEEYLLRADQIKKLRDDLGKYVAALHKKQNCGYSLFDLINHMEEYEDVPLMKDTLISNPGSFDRQQLEDQIGLIEKLGSAAKAVVHTHQNPLSSIQLTKYSQTLKQSLPRLLDAYLESLKALQVVSGKIELELGIKLTDLNSIKDTYNIFTNAHQWNEKDIPKSWAEAANNLQLIAGIKSMSEHYLVANSAEEHLMQSWNKTILSQDGPALLNEYGQINAKWFLPKMLGMSSFAKKLAVFMATPVNKDQLLDELNTLCECQSETKEAESLYSKFSANILETSAGSVNWEDIHNKSVAAEALISNTKDINGFESFRTRYLGAKAVDGLLTSYTEALEKLLEDKDKLYSALEISANDSIDWISSEITNTKNIASNLDTLREWTIWNTVKSEVLRQNLAPIITAYVDGMDHETLFKSYMKRVYFELSNNIVENEPLLNSFSGSLFNDKISQFKQLDEKMLDLTKQEIYYRLATNVPNFTAISNKNSETGILQRAIQSGGRGLSIRKLFEQIPSLLFRLCPCMLMSPISAAQYLDPATAPFDLVIFDEASQLPTSKAVGALARGKECIIVGDPKQMPPTSFFASANVDEDNIETEDLESILDDCLALNMPQTHLLWHYRSRHESLIAFSNSRFYENNLYTFPSVNDRKSSVSLVHVDGVFERGKNRYNKEEAKAVVEEIKRRCYDEELSTRSVGVVTFNINQQNLIDDLLSEACANDTKLEAFVYDSDEPVFIKNLESVQGDERDVILFSVGYGPDEDGKVSMNFGPLNRDGGWRRLNVAVSRARWEMIVFSTLTPEQINLSRTSAEGVASLRAFLEYASGRELPNNEYSAKTDRLPSYGIATTIKKYLESKGYAADLNVGHSAYRVDIGVVDPKNSDRYILGIMLDGSSYSSAQSTRDREIAQINVLEGLGWNIIRVWAMDWWDNKDKEFTKIIAKIEELKDVPIENALSGANVKKDTSEVIANENKKIASNFAAPKKEDVASYEYLINTYERAVVYSRIMSADEFVDYSNIREILRLTHEVVDVEAPITMSLLTKRVINSCGLTRAGSRIQATMNDIIKYSDVVVDDSKGNIVIWDKSQNSDTYYKVRADGVEENHRDVRDIPGVEALNAICFVLDTQGGMDRASLIREAANTMGYTRIGNNVEALFSDAIFEAIDKKYADFSNNRVMLTAEGSNRAKLVADASAHLIKSV